MGKYESPSHLTSIKIAEHLGQKGISELGEQEILKKVAKDRVFTDKSLEKEYQEKID